MPGAWYYFDSPACVVKVTGSTRVYGASTWCYAHPTSYATYNVHQWNLLYPGWKISPVPAHCPVPPAPPQPLPTAPPTVPPPPPPAVQQPPSGGSTTPLPPSGGANGPVTGDPPLPDPCAPAMSKRTGSRSRYGFDTDQHLEMPRTGVFYSVRNSAEHLGGAYEPAVTGAPEFTKPSKVVHRGNMIHQYEPGAGPGHVVFAPGDINEFGLRGDSVHPEGAWPRPIARSALTIMVGERDPDTLGDDVRQVLAFGLPTARSFRPVWGQYFDLDPSIQTMRVAATDQDADDTPIGRFQFDVAMTVGSYDDASRDLMTTATLVEPGTIIWNTDSEELQQWDGDSWESLGGAGELVEDSLTVAATDTPDLDDADQWVLTSASSVTLGGIDAPADTAAVVEKTIINANATYSITIPNGGNVSTGTGGSYTLAAGQAAKLRWSPSETLWYFV